MRLSLLESLLSVRREINSNKEHDERVSALCGLFPNQDFRFALFLQCFNASMSVYDFLTNLDGGELYLFFLKFRFNLQLAREDISTCSSLLREKACYGQGSNLNSEQEEQFIYLFFRNETFNLANNWIL